MTTAEPSCFTARPSEGGGYYGDRAWVATVTKPVLEKARLLEAGDGGVQARDDAGLLRT